MPVPIEQVPPLIQALQQLPPWVTHLAASLGTALVTLAGAYWKLALDISFIKGELKEAREDRREFKATKEDVERLKRRFARLKERSEHAAPLSQPRQSIY